MLITVLIIISVCLLLGLIYLWRENQSRNVELDDLDHTIRYRKDLNVYPMTAKVTIRSDIVDIMTKSELEDRLISEFKSSLKPFLSIKRNTYDNGETWEYTATLNVADQEYYFTNYSLDKLCELSRGEKR